MKIQASKLTQNLVEEIRTILQKTIQLQNLSNDELNFRPNTESWTILECIEHLNRYSNFYLQEIEKRIDEKTNKTEGKNTLNPTQDYTFKSGFFGNYLANSMLPIQQGIVEISENQNPRANHSLKIGNKMKTFKDKNPIHSGVDRRVLTIFIDDQNEFIRLLEKSKQVDLNKTKVSLTLPLLKFNLGDTFRFIINHEIRHFLQIATILSNEELKNMKNEIVVK